MATVKAHYAEVLSDVYSWMCGGFEIGLRRNTEWINEHRLTPRRSGVAIDLGAGCGFLSIPLAKAGYSVTAIDLDAKLLDELKHNSGNQKIVRIQDDLMDFDKYVQGNVELIACMTDTVLHLESKEKVALLFDKAFNALEPEGNFLMTFRDLTCELTELDRFLPVRSDDHIIFTCFLEYEPETVKVHDIVYRNNNGQWNLLKSFYRKLRLSREWAADQLFQCGFKVDATVENGLVTVIASK